MLSLLILVPLAGLLLLNLPFTPAMKRTAWAFAFTVALAQVAMVLVAPAAAWSQQGFLAQYFSFGLEAKDLTRVLLLAIGIVMATTLMVGRSMITDDRQQFNFVNLLLVSIIGMNGVVLVTDLFSLYVFLEVTSVSSFILIAFNRDLGGLEGAFKYLILSAVATVLMLTGVALLMLVAGGTSFETVAAAMKP